MTNQPRQPLSCPRCGSTDVETTTMGSLIGGGWDPNRAKCCACQHQGNAGDWRRVAELSRAPAGARPVFREADVVRAARSLATIDAWLPRLRKSAAAIGAKPGSDVYSQVEALEAAAWLCSIVGPLSRPTEDGELLETRAIMCELMSLLGQAQEVAATLERYGRNGHVNRNQALLVGGLLQGRLQEVLNKIGVQMEGQQPEEPDA